MVALPQHFTPGFGMNAPGPQPTLGPLGSLYQGIEADRRAERTYQQQAEEELAYAADVEERAYRERVARIDRAHRIEQEIQRRMAAAKPPPSSSRGLRTTEFWVTAVVAVGSLAVAGGYLDSGDADTLVGALTQLVGLLGAAGVSGVYTTSRTRAKLGG